MKIEKGSTRTNRKTRHRRAAWLCRTEGFRPMQFRKLMRRLRRKDYRPPLGKNVMITYQAPAIKILTDFWHHDPHLVLSQR